MDLFIGLVAFFSLLLLSLFFIFIIFLIYFFSFFLSFTLSHVADRVKVLWPGVRPEPLR